MKRILQLGTFGLCVATLQAQTPLSPPHDHKFFDKTNLSLFSADFLTRTLDAKTTEDFLHNPCGCFHEQNIPFATGTRVGTYGYSLGIAGVVVGLSYVAHRTGHHKLERLIPLEDVGYDGRLVINNIKLNRSK
jgi:hypothetical protein